MPERMRRWVVGGLIVALLAFVAASLLDTSAPQESRALQLEQQLRCPVCKTVSIAESSSETAASMRRIVESQVAAGRSDEEIIDYFEQRYGAWVLLDPPRSGETGLLWVLPFVAALVGAAVLLRMRSTAPAPGAELSAEDRAEVERAKLGYRSIDGVDEP